MYEADETLLVGGLGLGKCIIALTAIDELISDGVLTRVLVVAPLAVATLTWAEEAGKWPHLRQPVAIACGTAKERTKAVESGAPIVVTNLESLDWMLEHYKSTFDGLCVDEMSKLKSAGGEGVKLLRKWAQTLKWRAGLSATPVAQAAEDIYSQALVLDGGKALGTRKQAFLDQYFDKADYQGYSFTPKAGALEQIAARLADLVYTAADTEYKASLPGVDTIIERIPFDAPDVAVYRCMDRKSVWGDVVAQNAAIRKGKLQQMAAGGLYAGDDDRELAWRSFHKHSAVCELLYELREEGEPAVVVYTYQFERDLLVKAFPDAPLLGGGSKLTRAQLAAFNAGEIPVLIMHHRSGGHGINLQMSCRYMIHLTPMWSADGWAQTIGRIHRRGQTRRCQRVVFITPDTVEDEMLSRVIGKALDEDEFMKLLADNEAQV